MTAPELRIQLFGSLTVIRGEDAITRFPTSRSRLLLAYLAYHRERAHSREFLAEMLWPGGNPDAIRLRLNQTLAELRRALGVPHAIESDRHVIRLSSMVETDLALFKEHLKAGRLKDAACLGSQDFLVGMAEDWILEVREHLAETQLTIFLRLAESAEDPMECLDHARLAVRFNRYSESARIAVIRALIELDRRTDAIEEFRRYRRLLREDFAIEPGDVLSELFDLHGIEVQEEPYHRSSAKEGKPLPVAPLDTEDALTTYISHGDASRAMRLASNLYHFWNLHGELGTAYRWLKESLSMPEALHASPVARCEALLALATAAMYLGKTAETARALEAASQLAGKLRDPRLLADTARSSGSLALRFGKHEAAIAHFEKSIDFQRRLGDKSALSESYTGIGEAHRFLGDLAASESCHLKALRLRRASGRMDRVAQSELNLGIVASRRGEHVKARRLLKRSLASLRIQGSRNVVADALMEIAGVLVERGDAQRATRLLAASNGLRDKINSPIGHADLRDYVRFVSKARSSLSKEEFDQAWESGRNLSAEAAVNEALL